MGGQNLAEMRPTGYRTGATNQHSEEKLRNDNECGCLC